MRQLMEVAKDTKPGAIAEGAHVHVVHLSDGEDTLSLIKVCAPLTLLIKFYILNSVPVIANAHFEYQFYFWISFEHIYIMVSLGLFHNF